MRAKRFMEKPHLKKQRRFLHRTHTFWITIFVIVVVIGSLRQLHRLQEIKDGKNKPRPVVVSTIATSKNVPVYISALGSVVPTYSVTVKSQVTGYLERVLFTEGQDVKKGDLLAEIDQRPLLAQLTEYEGQLIRDRALLANALIDLKRYQTLWKQDSISQQTLATQEALVKQYEGAVKTDEGLIQTIRVNLIYCHITAPVDGRIGLRLVDPGNVVQITDTTGIAIINTINPITVVFTIPEDVIPAVTKKIVPSEPLTVMAYNRQQTKLLSTGKLLTIDNQIDPTTGTVKLKALFENKDNRLFPNQFVNVQLQVDTLTNATVVPTMAIQNSIKGDFVYLVNNNTSVTAKPIKTGIAYREETVILNGLTPGQAVVIEGADKLIDGAKVKVANKREAPSAKRMTDPRHGHDVS